MKTQIHTGTVHHHSPVRFFRRILTIPTFLVQSLPEKRNKKGISPAHGKDATFTETMLGTTTMLVHSSFVCTSSSS
jgi:hypothetical protein